MDFANIEQAELWSQLAQTWLEMEERFTSVSELPGRLAMDRLELHAGQQVLDIGCGTGMTTLELASRVGPDGSAVGLDIASEMLVKALERAAAGGAVNATFVHGDAEVHDLGADRFDAAYSRFGVMFFADPAAAFSNVRKAVRPGGTLSFVCWESLQDNEWMLIPAMAVAEVTGSPPRIAGPGEPGPYSLADPDRVQGVLEAAGWHDVDVAPHNDHLVFGEEDIPEVARARTQIGCVRAALNEADDDTRARAVAAIELAIRSRLRHGEVRQTRGVLLVSAKA